MSNTESKRLEILAALNARQRAPFAAELAKWLANAPSDADVAKYAAKSPDRWSQGVAVLAKASGFSEKVEIEVPDDLVGFAMRIKGMSDAQLETEYQQRLAATTPRAKPKVSRLPTEALDRLPTRGRPA